VFSCWEAWRFVGEAIVITVEQRWGRWRLGNGSGSGGFYGRF